MVKYLNLPRAMAENARIITQGKHKIYFLKRLGAVSFY